MSWSNKGYHAHVSSWVREAESAFRVAGFDPTGSQSKVARGLRMADASKRQVGRP